jgi:hypothetical protein
MFAWGFRMDTPRPDRTVLQKDTMRKLLARSWNILDEQPETLSRN